MNSLEKISAAFDRKDYQEARKLLQVLLHESPNNPSVQLYLARLHEVSGKLDDAEKVYRELLRNAMSPKIAASARQGLQRLEDIVKDRRQQAIDKANTDPKLRELGLLIIEPVSAEIKTIAAKHFAAIMQLDIYTARVLLPVRNWRIYRTGALGELKVYVEELKAVGIPSFCVSFSQIQSLRVLRIGYFQSVSPKPTVVCKNETDQLGQLSFDWGEVSERVEALIPIFKSYADFDFLRDQVSYKEQTQEYAHVCDLHLPRRGCILRLVDQHYDFQQGVSFTPPPLKGAISPTPSRGMNWTNLIKFLHRKQPQVKVWSAFNNFAESVVNQDEILSRIKPQLYLFRRTESNWDPAFELYSRLLFLKNNPMPG